MSNDIFGAPPQEEEEGFVVPDESDDPYRPIGRYDDNNELISGKGSDRRDVPGKCIAAIKKQGPKGPMIVATFVATETDFAGREFDVYLSFSPAARGILVSNLQALGQPTNAPVVASRLVGIYVILGLQDELYNDRWSAKAKVLKKHPKGAGYRGTSDLASIEQAAEKAVPF